jgi:hypothetical protein
LSLQSFKSPAESFWPGGKEKEGDPLLFVLSRKKKLKLGKIFTI